MIDTVTQALTSIVSSRLMFSWCTGYQMAVIFRADFGLFIEVDAKCMSAQSYGVRLEPEKFHSN